MVVVLVFSGNQELLEQVVILALAAAVVVAPVLRVEVPVALEVQE